MYNEILLDKNSHPLYRGRLSDFTKEIKLKNASCGDEISVYLKIEDNKIIDGSFNGIGCAISQASTDIMLGAIIGKSIKEAEEICKTFLDTFINEPKNLCKLGEAAALEGVSHMPARTKCATLPWQIFKS